MATRATRPSIGLVILTVLSLTLSLVAYARPVQATHTDGPLVEPMEFPGSDNKTCGQLDEGLSESWDHEFKIEPVSSGLHIDPNSDFEVTISVANDTLAWSSNLPVLGVFVKGGPVGGHLYHYTPISFPVTHDTGLTVMPDSNGKLFGISHVSFCFDERPRLPALEIAKTPDDGIVNAGDPLGFSITVTNTGDADATNVDIDDNLDTRFTWTDDKDECSITPNQVLHCDVPTLAPDASFTVTLGAPTDGTVCGPIPNTAFADADGITQIDDDGQVTVNCADIRIEKTPDGGNVEIGGAITFALTVHNDGAGQARGVVVSDSLPGTGWSIVAAETTLASCGLVGNDLTCGPDTIDAGGSKQVTVARTAVFDTDCGRIDNTANVDTSNDGMDDDTGHVDVLCADVDVDKTPDGAQVTAGDAATFSIVTTNTGNATATGVTLVDALPTVDLGWTIVAADTDWADCQITGDPGDPQTLTCGPESIGAGDDRTVKVTTTATAKDCGLLNNPKAEATTTNDGSDEDAGSINVLCADIDVEKSPDGAEAYAGDEVAFAIVTTNLGDGEARDATLGDTLPAVTNGWAIDDALTDWADCSITGAAGAQQALSCGPEDIAAGSGNTRTVVVTTTLTATDCGELNNPEAEATTSNDGSDVDSGSMTVLCPDVSIEKTAGQPVSAGGVASFEIAVTAGGTGTSTNVMLTDTLIGEQGDWSFDVTGADDSDCQITVDPKLLCDFGDLAAGTQISIDLTYRTGAADCPSIANSASVMSDNDTNPDNSDSAQVTVDCPDVTIDKEPIESPISAGAQGQFSMTVWNLGPGIASDVEVVDTAPAGTTWTVLDDDGFDCSSDVSSGQQTLTCTLDELAAGEANARTMLIGYTTGPADCGELENSVAVSASNESAEDALNNGDEASIIVECPGLNIVKTADADSVVAGEEASFTITIWNEGPGTAHDVEFEDELPAGLDWSFELLDGFDPVSCESSADESGTLGISCSLGDLADEQEVRIRVFADTDRSDCGSLENLAWAEASNNDRVGEGAEIDVSCPTLTIDKEADADLIVISGPAGDLEADPAVVTWTLSYTLTDGPVTNAVISDELPTGLVYVDGSASDGGVHDAASNTLTWTFATLSESGSVTFETEVDPETISRVAPTENVAVISSDQTPEDEGQDEVAVTVEQELGGNPTPTPTPEPRLPDTAMGFGPGGEPITVPVELMAVVFLGSLGGLALANMRAARGRRR